MGLLRFVPVIAVAVLAIVFASFAQATSAIYVGDDASYGFCYGERSGLAARECALARCKSVNGPNCQLALQCQGGWGAMAWDNKGGYGTVCETNTANSARLYALIACIRAVRGFCWTQDAFSNSRVDGAESNASFDRVFYGQVALYRLGHTDETTIDGVAGRKTRNAIMAFQRTQPGLTVNGRLDQVTFDRMLQAVGGIDTLLPAFLKMADLHDMASWSMRAAPGKAQNTAPPAAPLSSSEIVALLGVGEADLTTAIEEGFGTTGIEYELQGKLACTSPANGPRLTCSVDFYDPGRTGLGQLGLHLFDVGDPIAQAKTLAEAAANAEAPIGQLVTTKISWTVTKKGATDSTSYSGQCVQKSGGSVSKAICYVGLTSRLSLESRIAPILKPTADGSVIFNDETGRDLDKSQDLLFSVFGQFSGLSWRE